MRMRMISSVLGGGLLTAAAALAAEPQQVWQAQGLDGPESAVLDSGEGVIYVSNVNGEAGAADGNGYISKLSPQGRDPGQGVGDRPRMPPRAWRSTTASSTSPTSTSWW